MNINEAYEFLNFISNKNQSGTVTPTQFNQLATQAQWENFEKEYTKWQQTQDVTDVLATFIKHLSTSVSATGRLSYPSDYQHAISTGHYFVKKDNTGIDIPVHEVDNNMYREHLQSEVVTPTLRFPIWTAYSDYMQFEPKNIGLISFDYFRKPVNPFWAYTTVNNRPVYDPILSVDWEMPEQTHLTLVMMMCNYLGMNLRMPDLVQYTEMQKAELKQ
jgi:hypothetical protein